MTVRRGAPDDLPGPPWSSTNSATSTREEGPSPDSGLSAAGSGMLG